MTIALHNVSKRDISLNDVMHSDDEVLTQAMGPIPLLFFACFRPSDILLSPAFDYWNLADNYADAKILLPVVDAEQALENLKSSRDFLRKVTRAGELADQYLDLAIQTWPRFKKPYLALFLGDFEEFIITQEDDGYLPYDLNLMLSQKAGAHLALRSFVDYSATDLPYPPDAVPGVNPKRFSERRAGNTISLRIPWKDRLFA